MVKRNLTDREIRAVAYRACADEIYSGVDHSENPSMLCGEAGGNEVDDTAVRRQMKVIMSRLYSRANRLSGKATISDVKAKRSLLPEQPTPALLQEMHDICSASTRGKPLNIQRLVALREAYTEQFDQIASEESRQAKNELLALGGRKSL